MFKALFCAALVAAFPVAAHERVPKVQIALLLDNSGSMEGLINQARTQLWRIVNTFGTAKRDGMSPRLEIALYEYGETIRRISPFTSELDRVSESLFGLGIRGGDEYCGAVIDRAVRELEWSSNPDDLKLIYIAGNEPFTQGPVDYRAAIAGALRKGITVNTIHCGGDEPSWRDGALVAGGSYLTINQNAVVAHVAAPQDAELARLGAELNKTYLGYGAAGARNVERQKAQDAKAEEAGASTAVARSVAKGSALYKNSSWDLVDGVKEGAVKVDAMKDDQLPAEMRGMSAPAKKALVEQKAKERAEIQTKIAELNEARQKFVEAEQKKAPAAPATLDSAVVESARSQAAKKAFKF